MNLKTIKANEFFNAVKTFWEYWVTSKDRFKISQEWWDATQQRFNILLQKLVKN